MAHDLLCDAIQIARTQGALLWELRAAVDLLRLAHQERQDDKAVDLVKVLYERFTEGFATQDLTVATDLLDHLRV